MATALGLAAIPAIAEGLGTLAAGVAEVTGSQVAGQLTAGAVLGTAAGAIEKKASQTYDALYGEGSSAKLSQQLSDRYTEAESFLFYDPTTQDPNELLETINRKKEENRAKIKEVAKLAVDIANESSIYGQETGKISIDFNKQDQDNIVQRLITKNPLYANTLGKLLEYTGDLVIPNNEEYKRIASVYNGISLDPSQIEINETEDGFTEFSIIDEAGKKLVWSTAFNDYVVIPTIYGLWTGLSSPNNGIWVDPETGRRSLLDTFAMMHDISYLVPERGGLGPFNKTGDYKLIARADANRDRFVLAGERETAIIAINYFSTLGNLMRKMTGGSSDTTQNEGITPESFVEAEEVDLTIEANQMLLEEVMQEHEVNGIVSGRSNVYLANLINNLQLEID